MKLWVPAMNIAVPSRFACLKIEDDEFRSASHSSKQKSANRSNKKANDAAKNSAVNGSKKKQSSNADVSVRNSATCPFYKLLSSCKTFTKKTVK